MMPAKLIFDPSSGSMNYACGVSGSGSNYEEIYKRDPHKHHVVFSSVSDCTGVDKAKGHGAPVVVLDSARYYYELIGSTKPSRRGVERNSYDIAMAEQSISMGCKCRKKVGRLTNMDSPRVYVSIKLTNGQFTAGNHFSPNLERKLKLLTRLKT